MIKLDAFFVYFSRLFSCDCYLSWLISLSISQAEAPHAAAEREMGPKTFICRQNKARWRVTFSNNFCQSTGSLSFAREQAASWRTTCSFLRRKRNQGAALLQSVWKFALSLGAWCSSTVRPQEQADYMPAGRLVCQHVFISFISLFDSAPRQWAPAGRSERERDAVTGFGENAASGTIKRSQTPEKEATALFFFTSSAHKEPVVYMSLLECAHRVCVRVQ